MSINPVKMTDILALPTVEGVRISTTGDIHLYHHKVTTVRILKHLGDMYTPEYVSTLDMIVFNGDVFDRRVQTSSECFYLILYWIMSFLHLCKRHGVILVIVEGTRSHDHKQSLLFRHVNDTLNIGCDLRYFDKVTACEILGLRMLFIPDEVNADASITEDIVLKEVKHAFGDDEGVDFTFIHGMFPHHLPISGPSVHRPAFYENLTRHYVINNHVHKASDVGKLKGPGSPVRLVHGEESAKVHHLTQVTEDGVKGWFIEVENNVVFNTYDLTNMTYQQVIELYDELAEVLEHGSHIRNRLTRSSEAYPSLTLIKHRYPQFKFTEDFTDTDEGKVSEQDLSGAIHITSLNLTQSTIDGLLRDSLTEKLEHIGRMDLIDVLEEVLNER